MHYIASDIGRPLFNLLQGGPLAAKTLYVYFLLLGLALVMVAVCILVIRKLIIKDHPDDNIFKSGF